MRSSATDAAALVIGYGNSLRRDDGAGLILAAKLAAQLQAQGRTITLLTSHQLNPEMAEDIAETNAPAVFFVDAEAAGENGPFAIRLAPVATGENSPSLGHHFSPGLLMIYAANLYGYAGAAWTLTVPGYDFAHGEGLSPQTEALIAAFHADTLPF